MLSNGFTYRQALGVCCYGRFDCARAFQNSCYVLN
jgi:hypothetical protein